MLGTNTHDDLHEKRRASRHPCGAVAV